MDFKELKWKLSYSAWNFKNRYSKLKSDILKDPENNNSSDIIPYLSAVAKAITQLAAAIWTLAKKPITSHDWNPNGQPPKIYN